MLALPAGVRGATGSRRVLPNCEAYHRTQLARAQAQGPGVGGGAVSGAVRRSDSVRPRGRRRPRAPAGTKLSPGASTTPFSESPLLTPVASGATRPATRTSDRHGHPPDRPDPWPRLQTPAVAASGVPVGRVA